MKNIVTVSQMRDAETACINSGTESIALMYRAGRGIAEFLLNRIKPTDKVAVVCGHGNNGGDGFVAAWMLDGQGVDVSVFLVGDAQRLTSDSSYYYKKCKHLVKPMPDSFCKYDVILDAIYGTGFHGELDINVKAVTQKINESQALVVSADIPSGVNGETGEISDGAVKADVTLCIEAVKTACACGRSAELAGELETVEIGVNLPDKQRLISLSDVEFLLPRSDKYYHKNCYGSVGIVGGCEGMEGAAMLSAMAAAKCGAGKVSIISDLPYYFNRPHHIMQRSSQDTSGMDALAYGMGAGREDACKETLKALLLTDTPLVLDADGVYMLDKELKQLIKKRRQNGAITVITPHIGEAARLTGNTAEQIHCAPIACAVNINKELGCITVLKSWYTVICCNDEVRVLNMPQRALAKAGSGDCLAGIVAAMLARSVRQNTDVLDAISAAVLVHSAAGKRASEKFGTASATATDIIDSIFIDN